MFKIKIFKEIKKEKVVKDAEDFMKIKKGDVVKLGGEVVKIKDVKSF